MVLAQVRSLTLALPPRKPAYKQESRPSQCFAYTEIMCTVFRWVPRAMPYTVHESTDEDLRSSVFVPTLGSGRGNFCGPDNMD